MRSKTCPRCGSRMGEGALLVKDTAGGKIAAEWLEGPKETSIWTGLKTKGRAVLPITAFRCERCGLVENYAENIANPPPG